MRRSYNDTLRLVFAGWVAAYHLVFLADLDPGGTYEAALGGLALTSIQGLFVAAGDGFIEILEIKPSSGRIMGWPDFVNGRHVGKGDGFVSLLQ